MANFMPVTSMQRLEFPDAIGIDQLKRRNALAERSMTVQEQNAAGYQNQLGMTQENMRRNWLAQDQERDAREALTLAKYGKQARTPEEFASVAQRLSQIPTIAQAMQQQGKGWQDITPAELDDIEAAYGSKLGVGPAVPFEQTPEGMRLAAEGRSRIDLENVRFKHDQALERMRQQAKPSGSYRPLTPEEVTQVGLPPGTSAQVSPDGKIDVLSKRDNTGALSQKDLNTARQKLTTVALARQQLEKIKEKFAQGTQGINAFGPGQGLLPTQQGKAFDAAVDQMRSTLTALTRVPGIGAMSDYETKLDQSKFPKRGDYETVTAQKIQGIEDMLALLENGYSDMVPENLRPKQPPRPTPSAPAAPKSSGGWKVTPVP